MGLDIVRSDSGLGHTRERKTVLLLKCSKKYDVNQYVVTTDDFTFAKSLTETKVLPDHGPFSVLSQSLSDPRPKHHYMVHAAISQNPNTHSQIPTTHFVSKILSQKTEY